MCNERMAVYCDKIVYLFVWLLCVDKDGSILGRGAVNYVYYKRGTCFDLSSVAGSVCSAPGDPSSCSSLAGALV